MPGNEKDVVRYLLKNKDDLELNHLKKIQTIETPTRFGIEEIKNPDDIENHIKPDDAHKKADILLNKKGISVKQENGSVAYNKIQRKFITKVLEHLNFDEKEIKKIKNKLDEKVQEFHDGKILRDVSWKEIFSENQFKKILEHYMMKGSSKILSNDYPCEFILTAPRKIENESIKVYSFDEFFNKKKDKMVLALRRVWPDQASKSESGRALSIAKDLENKPWVLDGLIGKPRTGWKNTIIHNKSCYYINIIENK